MSVGKQKHGTWYLLNSSELGNKKMHVTRRLSNHGVARGESKRAYHEA